MENQYGCTIPCLLGFAYFRLFLCFLVGLRLGGIGLLLAPPHLSQSTHVLTQLKRPVDHSSLVHYGPSCGKRFASENAVVFLTYLPNFLVHLHLQVPKLLVTLNPTCRLLCSPALCCSSNHSFSSPTSHLV